MLVACLAGNPGDRKRPAQAAPGDFHILISNAAEGENLVDLVFPGIRRVGLRRSDRLPLRVHVFQ